MRRPAGSAQVRDRCAGGLQNRATRTGPACVNDACATKSRDAIGLVIRIRASWSDTRSAQNPNRTDASKCALVISKGPLRWMSPRVSAGAEVAARVTRHYGRRR